MAAYVKPLLDGEGNTIYPPTKAKIVYMSDNTTSVETAVNSALTAANTASSNASTALSTANSKATTTLYTATIGTSWTGSAAPYTQTIAVSGILASDTPIVDVNLASTAYADKDAVVEAYSKVYRITTADNSITVYADEATSVAIPIQLKVVR